MNFSETFKAALRALSANKGRAVLTMLGVIIGVFAVVTLISLGRGIQNYITDQFNALGSNLLFIAPGRAGFTDDPALSFSNNKLDEKHIDLIETYAADYIQAVTPSIRTGASVRYKTKTYFAAMTGSSYDSNKIFDLSLEDGRFFTKSEERSKAKVAVIGPLVSKELFSNTDPIGKTIKINDDSYEVIGVTKEKGQDFDEQIVAPYTTVQETFDIKNFSGIATKAKTTDLTDEATRQVRYALLRDLKEDEFSILSQQDILSSIQSILQILTLGIGAIAGISLLVGGIGIMNIMLVSVTERIKEIGLRKALGATPFNIGLQFLIESVLLSVGGGTIGLVLGFLGSLVARNFVRTEVPWWAVALAFGFAVAVGVIFGTYPAIKASKKDPIEALRYE